MTENPDIICLTETHLRNNSTIEIEGFSGYSLNRDIPERRAGKGSGGICVLYKRALTMDFEIENNYCLLDNVLGVKFRHRISDKTFCIYCVYLPPDNSKYSLQNEDILNNLTIEMYRQQECDKIYLCGDFNARIGSKEDCLYCDDFTKRQHIDEISNKQGEKLLTFVNDFCGCIINGRVTKEYDDYTSVTSYRGKAVVDYHITQQSDLTSVMEFKVLSMVDLANEFNLCTELNENCHLPDHSMLCMTIELSSVLTDILLEGGNTLGCFNYRSERKVLRKVGDSHMSSDLARRMLIKEFDRVETSQTAINEKYDSLVDFILEEAEKSRGMKSKHRKSNTKFKEYWDAELTASWNKMHEHERVFRLSKKTKDHADIRCKRLKFKKSQKLFDKLLKKKKRGYNKGQMILIEECNIKDSNAFWNHIKKLGPKKTGKYPGKWLMLMAT